MIVFEPKTPKPAAGFTLMEVLVTVIILSIGLLGVAGLQFGSLRGNQEALHSSIAAALAAEGADRIRANLPGVRNPNTGEATRTEYDLITEQGTEPACITGTGCSYEDLAQHDAYEWIKNIKALLPGGEGTICRDNTPYDGVSSGEPACSRSNNAQGLAVFAVKVWWDHDRDSSTPLLAYRVSIVP